MKKLILFSLIFIIGCKNAREINDDKYRPIMTYYLNLTSRYSDTFNCYMDHGKRDSAEIYWQLEKSSSDSFNLYMDKLHPEWVVQPKNCNCK